MNGHFVAFVRRGMQWLKCDDSIVTEMNTIPAIWPHIIFSPHCHVGFLFSLLHPAAASSSAAATSSTQRHQHNIINTTPSTQHHQHNTINTSSSTTTPTTRHHLHNILNTTPSTLHHQKQPSSTQHLHNIINTTPSTLHHQKQHHQHNIISTPSNLFSLLLKLTQLIKLK